MKCYPQLADRAVVMAIDKLEIPPPPSGHLLQIPLIWTSQEHILRSLLESLGSTHRLEADHGLSGEATAWIFIPTMGARPRPGAAVSRHAPGARVRGGSEGHDRPWDLAADSAGRIFAVVQGEDQIHVYSPEGRLLDSWGPTGDLDSVFAEPSAVVIDSRDSLWVLDTLAGKVFHASATGEPLPGSMEGVGYTPRGLGLAPNDDLLLAMTGDGEVRRVDGSGRTVFTLPGSSGVKLAEPTDVVMTPEGDWFILAARNPTVWSSGSMDVR